MKKETKVKYQWEPVLAEDLISHYGIDVEAELTKMLNEEIGKELKKELKKLANKMPAVTGRIRPLTVSLDV